MKKLTALLLALCMLSAAAFALGDILFVQPGTWYMTMKDVTLASIELNSDGTALMKELSGGETSGTWTSDGRSISLTMSGGTEIFNYDGTSLKNSVYTEMYLSREEGTLSLDLIAKMMANEPYDLPEGMTETDVMAILMGFLAEYQNLQQSGVLPTESTGGTSASADVPDKHEEPAVPAAPAEPDVTVLQENFRVRENYIGYQGIYIAKLKNETDIPLYVTDGTLTVKDAAGKIIGEEKYFYPEGSTYLEPGEITFVGLQADLEGNGDFADVTWEKTIKTETDSYRGPDTTIRTADPVYVKGTGAYDNDTMKVTVINDSDQPVPGIEVIFVLEDAEGNLLAIEKESLYRYELGPNSTINIVASVESNLRDYLTANGIEPAVVEAFAWTEK